MSAVTSAGVMHEVDRVGSIGYVTLCRVAIKKDEAKPAKVYRDWRGVRWTEKYGEPCRICYKETK